MIIDIESAETPSTEWRGLFAAFESYRKILDSVMLAENLQQKLVRMVEEARLRYAATLKAVHDAQEFSSADYDRYLLHIKKTIAGLQQLFLLHAVRKLRPSQQPFSLFHRIRQLMATHPAMAPPPFA